MRNRRYMSYSDKQWKQLKGDTVQLNEINIFNRKEIKCDFIFSVTPQI